MKIKSLLIVYWCAIMCTLFVYKAEAINVDLANQLFHDGEYQKAKKEYLLAVNSGNPAIYYQLGMISLKEDTPNKDINAIIWFALAAEQDYENSAQIYSEIMSNIAPSEREKVIAIVAKFKSSYGIEKVKKKYYPELKDEQLKNKISFENSTDSSNHFETTELFEDDFEQSFDDEDPSVFEDDYDSGWTDNTFARQQPRSIENRNYFLVVDYDVAPDGSRRDFSPVQVIGNPRKGIEQLAHSPLSTPMLDNNSVSFVHRAYLGVANYSIFQIRKEFPSLYSKIRKLVSRLKGSDVADEQYKLALIYSYFTWLKIEDQQIEELLLDAANKNHARAQFEYGMKLYREQREIKTSLKWIEKAAQAGVFDAQYRLGKLLLDSPFVKNDQSKAAFWLNAAAYNGHMMALKHLTYLKLDANVDELIDVKQAIENLDVMQSTFKDDPEYYYLRALAYRNKESRRLDLAVISMREAIDLADDYGWDVTEWQNMLKQWTSGGSVTIAEIEEG